MVKHGVYRIVAVSRRGGGVEFPGMRTLHAACTVLQYCTGKGFPVSYRQRFSRIVQAKVKGLVAVCHSFCLFLYFITFIQYNYPITFLNRHRFYRIVQAKVFPYRTGKGFTLPYRIQAKVLSYRTGLYRLFNFIFSAACYSHPIKATFQD